MHIQTRALGPLQANCYLVWQDDPKTVVVIDPGDDAQTLKNALSSA